MELTALAAESYSRAYGVSWNMLYLPSHNNYYYYTRSTALFPGLSRWASTRKVKPIWILLKQETASGSGISWAICKSAPSSRQITMPAPHHSVFYRPDALPATQPTASKHWRQRVSQKVNWYQADPCVQNLTFVFRSNAIRSALRNLSVEPNSLSNTLTLQE